MKQYLTTKEIDDIHNVATKKVKVHCDEYHAHTALDGCLFGEATDIEICQLVSHIHYLEGKLVEISKLCQEKG